MNNKRRVLTDDEKRIYLDSKKRIKEEMLVAKDFIAYYKMMVDKIIFRNYQQTLETYKQKMVEAENAVLMGNDKIKQMDDHLTNGVEVKEKKEDAKQK